MPEYSTRPLDAETVAGLRGAGRGEQRRVGRVLVHGLPPQGARGGARAPAQNRAEKELRVRNGEAHAALVYDDGRPASAGASSACPTSCHGSRTRSAYLDGLDDLPDWRITCFFVGQGPPAARGSPPPRSPVRSRRSPGSAAGSVESYPDEVDGQADLGLVPAQRHGRHVRARGVRADPPHRQDPLGGPQDRRLTD